MRAHSLHDTGETRRRSDKPTCSPGGEWQLGIAYRRLASDEFFVGTRETLGPGQAPEFRINTFVADVGYAFNDKFRLRLAVPFSTGHVVIRDANNVTTEHNASGIGDMSGRFDGIPVHDLVGGGDETRVKRSSQILYADPGLSVGRGKSTFTLSVPVRMWVNREKSELEQSTGGVNGGGIAKYLLFASYAWRF